MFTDIELVVRVKDSYLQLLYSTVARDNINLYKEHGKLRVRFRVGVGVLGFVFG